MKRIIECVPNISEGRDRKKIGEIVSSVGKEVRLLGVESNPHHNRTVITFAGEPAIVADAAYSLIMRSAALIDMAGHKGGHPRMGAVDVCPFVPIIGASMDDCVKIAHNLGKVVGQRGLSGYFYGRAALCPERAKLSDIRRGEYEALAEKLERKEWRPDFGPASFDPKFGCTVIGAREYLVAFNINLRGADMAVAGRIAKTIRGSGGMIGGVKIKGKFPSVQAIAVDEKSHVQVSMNLLDYKTTSIHIVFTAVKRLAERGGADILGSEIVGLVPARAIKYRYAMFDRLKLNTFDPEKQIIEEVLGLWEK